MAPKWLAHKGSKQKIKGQLTHGCIFYFNRKWMKATDYSCSEMTENKGQLRKKYFPKGQKLPPASPAENDSGRSCWISIPTCCDCGAFQTHAPSPRICCASWQHDLPFVRTRRIAYSGIDNIVVLRDTVHKVADLVRFVPSQAFHGSQGETLISFCTKLSVNSMRSGMPLLWVCIPDVVGTLAPRILGDCLWWHMPNLSVNLVGEGIDLLIAKFCRKDCQWLRIKNNLPYSEHVVGHAHKHTHTEMDTMCTYIYIYTSHIYILICIYIYCIY